jgi:hypothetical protein
MTTAKAILIFCIVAAMFWAVLAWDFGVALFRTAILGESADDQMEGKL